MPTANSPFRVVAWPGRLHSRSGPGHFSRCHELSERGLLENALLFEPHITFDVDCLERAMLSFSEGRIGSARSLLLRYPHAMWPATQSTGISSLPPEQVGRAVKNLATNQLTQNLRQLPRAAKWITTTST